jgi:hypothetical protein
MYILVRQIVIPIMIILLAGIFGGCFPFGPEDVSDFDIVATLYNENYNFRQVTSFAMPDSIAHITDGSTSNISRQYDQIILDQVASNMQALGYERELDPETNGADVLVTVSITNSSYNVYAGGGYSNYWGWYGGYGYESGYGYSYPGYGGTNYEVRTGTLIIQIIDPNNPDANNNLPTQWIGLVNGLTDDTAFNVRTRLVNTINQCFVQSPYLGSDQI